jgi:hemerythrin-like domain-containing protein
MSFVLLMCQKSGGLVMVVFEKLIEEHNTVKSQLNQCLTAMRQGESVNMDLIQMIHQELTLHMRLEEECVYPVLRNLEDTRSLIEDAFEEHEQVKGILSVIQQLDMNNQREELQTQLKKLQDAVGHHVEEEEGETFPAAQDLLSQEDIQKIETQMNTLREQEMSRQQRVR